MVNFPCPIVQLFRRDFAESLGKLGLDAACLPARRIRKFYDAKSAVSAIGAPSASALLLYTSPLRAYRGTALGIVAVPIGDSANRTPFSRFSPTHTPSPPFIVAAMARLSSTFTRTPK